MSKKCLPGCTCAKHDSAARRAAADARWAKATPADRAAQAARMEVARRHWMDIVVEASKQASRVSPGDRRVIADGDVFEIAARLHVRVPTERTVKRYGITQREWLELLAAQGWACAVCLRLRPTMVTDHEHVPGWKNMPPEHRRRYVRGILCTYDNYRIVPSRMSAEEAGRMVAYLLQYEARRDA